MVLAVLAATLSACSPVRSDRPAFAVTIAPLAAALRPVVEGRAEVTVLIPPGASEHTYEVTPAGARAASGARALLYVDDSMDGWAARIDAGARISFSSFVPAERLLQYDDHALDPHMWLDPVVVSAALPKLVDAISGRDPDGAAIYRTNADTFARELELLDREIAEMLKPLQGRAVIQFHPSMFYFLARYGIQTASVIESIAGQEPSPKQLKELADLIRAQHVEVIVSEPQLADAPVRALAEASGARVAHLDPLGGVPGRETYAELLRYNAKALREAFP